MFILPSSASPCSASWLFLAATEAHWAVNSSASGDSADQDQKQQPQQKKQGGQAKPADNGPQSTVSGQPSAASDRGSADAVAHRSVAQPGAPEGTVPDSFRNPPPKPQSRNTNVFG